MTGPPGSGMAERGRASSCGCCQRPAPGPPSDSRGLAGEAPPVLQELPAELGDAGLAGAVPGGQLPGPLAQGHVPGDATVTVAQPRQPVGEVDAEGGLLVGRTLGVVAQRLEGAVVVAAAVLVGQRLHREVLALLGPWGQDVLGLLLA